MDLNELFQLYSEKTNKKKEELETIWNEVVKSLKAKGITNENIHRQEFRKRLRSLVWRESRSRNLVEFEGFLLGATRLRDLDEIRRRKALRLYE